MEKANIMLALGGDGGNQVPKFGVTPAEVAVLQMLHGNDSVTDIEITGTIERSNRSERQRLFEDYGHKDPSGNHIAPAVNALFPGVAARVFETFGEMELDESLFKPVERSARKRDPLDHDNNGKKGGSLPLSGEGFDNMTVADLKAYAEKNEIDLTGAGKKAEIIARLNEAEAAKEEQQDETAEDEDGVGDMNDGVGDTDGDDNLFK